MKRFVASWTLAVAACAAGSALAQDWSLAAYDGADRMERIAAAAIFSIRSAPS